MNVIISNKAENILSSLQIDVIKKVQGEFSANEIISMFGGKPDDIRTKLETAKENIEKLLATI